MVLNTWRHRLGHALSDSARRAFDRIVRLATAPHRAYRLWRSAGSQAVYDRLGQIIRAKIPSHPPTVLKAHGSVDYRLASIPPVPDDRLPEITAIVVTFNSQERYRQLPGFFFPIEIPRRPVEGRRR